MEEMHMQHEAPTTKAWKAVYTIVERDNGGKSFWVRIGTAFVNRDQSLTVKLDASPTNGKLHIRDADPDRFSNGYNKRSEATRSDGNGGSAPPFDPFGPFPGGRRGDGNGGVA